MAALVMFFCIGLCLFAVTFIIMASFILSVVIQYTELQKSISIRFIWLHSLVLYGTIDVQQQAATVHLFRRFCFTIGSKADTPGNGYPKPRDSVAAVSTDAMPHAPAAEKTIAINNAAPPDAVKSNGDTIKPPPVNGTASTIRGKILHGRVRKWFFRLHSVSRNPVVFFLRQAIWRQAMLRWLMVVGRLPRRLIPAYCIRMHLRANLGDPAITGEVYGYWLAVSAALALQKSKRVVLSFKPIFGRECLEINGRIRIKTSLLRIIAPFLVVALRFPYWTTFRVWRMQKKYTQRYASF